MIVPLEFELWPRQAMAISSPAREILYGGAAGGGKSHLNRMAIIAWAQSIPGLQIYFFRREYGDLVRNHIEGPTGLLALLGPLLRSKQVEFVGKELRFSNGSKVYLCHCQYEKDVFGYHGSEMHVLILEEATQFSEFMVRYLRTRLRAPQAFLDTIGEPWKGQFPRALYTSNPGGVGHAYFKRSFIDGHIPGEIWKAAPTEGGLTRQYIPAKLSDNPSLNELEYAQQLIGIGSEAYVRALLDGDWNASIGSFFPEFDYDRHVLQAPLAWRPPPHLFRFRTFDWGSAAPFAVFWWAVANGDKLDGIDRLIPRGALIAYREWYGCNEYSPAKGVGLRNEEIASGIRARSAFPEEQRVLTLTDSLPFQDRGGKTVAETFAANGVLLTEGDTSRVPGWSQFRSRLRGTEAGPGIFFVQTCVHAIRTIPLLQHDPIDQEDTVGEEDHAPDAIRLACMAREKIIALDKDEPKTDNIANNYTFNQVVERIRRRKASGTGTW